MARLEYRSFYLRHPCYPVAGVAIFYELLCDTYLYSHEKETPATSGWRKLLFDTPLQWLESGSRVPFIFFIGRQGTMMNQEIE